MTKYAKRILDLVCTTGKHMTAEQIFFLLKQEFPNVVLATVYNNLNALTEQGLIRRISMEGFADRYDTNVRHDHLVCIRCGKLKDVTLPDMTETFSAQTGTVIESYDLKLFYICDECKKSEQTSKAI